VTDRSLYFVNAAGVLALSVLAGIQWSQNRDQHHQLLDLEGDIQRLQTALLDTQKTADETSTALQQKTGELARVLAENEPPGARAEALAQIESWKKALAERDERLKTLNTQLGETRARLEEAIQRLKSKP
jgi:septal ring factor EnvC (AmiA/AmiB activator)